MRNLKSYLSRSVLIFVDLFSIYLSIVLAYGLRGLCAEWIETPFPHSLDLYVGNILVYAIVLVAFFNEKIYKYRYDFWEETRLVFRSLLISFVILLSILALSKNVESYSRFVLVFSFVAMGFFVPTMKNITKKLLFRFGVWTREAEVCGNDSYIKEEIFGNPYLGYVHSDHSRAQTIFIDTDKISAGELQKRLDENMSEKKEVLFIPLLQAYNFANVRIIELSNARKNLIVLENALLKKRNIVTKKISDLLLSFLLFPVLVLFFMVIVALMKREEPKGKIFFKQKRMGRNGKEFVCYKFRSMREDGEQILESYLRDNPEEIVCYDKYHKYKNDPRITKIGRLLRKTSLDELPQIINVLRGEMSLIGPRPYMPSEREKIGDKLDMVLAVKPGVTGLWQVSGRSEVDFHSRVDMDVWYTRNWNLWLDLVILIKTIKVVLFRDGAH